MRRGELQGPWCTGVDGHTVYKSDVGSWHVSNGTSTCTVTVRGYSSVTVYLRSYYTFEVLYSKDFSGNNNDDRGYFYIVTE